MTGCAYCGHEPEQHETGRCTAASLRIPAGTRDCTCTTYRTPEETP